MQLFVEHLTVIDSAYLDPEYGIVGESWIVDVTLEGNLDPQSMVMDFGHVKKRLKAAIDGSIDHTLIVPERAPGLTIAQNGDRLTLLFRFGNRESLEHRSPAHAVTTLPVARVTNDAIAEWLETRLMQTVPANVTRVGIALRHEDDAPAHYHYAHGLKKHDGNCQRIAHGHRSRVMVEEDGQRSFLLEASLAEDFNHAYVATLADRVGEDGSNSQFRYVSDQGEFFLSYPTARCRLIDTDSTVECIAAFMAARLKQANPQRTYRVRAYEGVHKGAVATA